MTPEEHKEITGFSTPAESYAYDKGREDEQTVMMEWIKNWDGMSNSAVGNLLTEKMFELLPKLLKEREKGNFERYKKQFDKNFAKKDPVEFIKEMEALGYVFEDIKYYKCNKCGQVASTEYGNLCTASMPVRSSGICGGSTTDEITKKEFDDKFTNGGS